MLEEGEVKLIDFGVATYVKEDDLVRTICGTYDFIAPEVKDQDCYSYEADMYSLGKILLAILQNTDIVPESTEGQRMTEILAGLNHSDPAKRLKLADLEAAFKNSSISFYTNFSP